MNILETITPTEFLAVVLIVYLIICLLGYFLGVRKFIIKSKSFPEFKNYIDGSIPNPGFPEKLIKHTSSGKKYRKKKINIFNE